VSARCTEQGGSAPGQEAGHCVPSEVVNPAFTARDGNEAELGSADAYSRSWRMMASIQG
jgi:hypothetical protein